MKNYKIIGLMVLACCLLVAAGAQAGPLFGSARNVDIALDGFCDGVHMTINYNTGVVVAVRTGCLSDLMVGSVGALNGKKYAGGAVTLMDPTHSLYMVIKDTPAVWAYYSLDGSIFNSGTYSVGAPAVAKAGAGPSTMP